MAKVELFFDTFQYEELNQKVKENFEIIRLRCSVQFKDENTWSETYDAIIDSVERQGQNLPPETAKSALFSQKSAHACLFLKYF